MIKIKFQYENMIKVKRAKNNIFKYKYEKSFRISNLLYKYIKKYNNKLTKSKKKENERVLMNILKDFNISKSINMNDKIILTNYFDSLISHEKY